MCGSIFPRKNVPASDAVMRAAQFDLGACLQMTRQLVRRFIENKETNVSPTADRPVDHVGKMSRIAYRSSDRRTFHLLFAFVTYHHRLLTRLRLVLGKQVRSNLDATTLVTFDLAAWACLLVCVKFIPRCLHAAAKRAINGLKGACSQVCLQILELAPPQTFAGLLRRRGGGFLGALGFGLLIDSGFTVRAAHVELVDHVLNRAVERECSQWLRSAHWAAECWLLLGGFYTCSTKGVAFGTHGGGPAENILANSTYEVDIHRLHEECGYVVPHRSIVRPLVVDGTRANCGSSRGVVNPNDRCELLPRLPARVQVIAAACSGEHAIDSYIQKQKQPNSYIYIPTSGFLTMN